MENINTLTPATIGDVKFNIPIYQRLFVWEEQHINRLLEDLYDVYGTKDPYYIGIITVSENKKEERYDLVDGQQRMTFLMLLGAALHKKYSDWNKFLLDCQRVTFFARPR